MLENDQIVFLLRSVFCFTASAHVVTCAAERCHVETGAYGFPIVRSALGSHVQIGDLQRIVFDEDPTGFDHVAHQRAEDLVGGDRVLDAYL